MKKWFAVVLMVLTIMTLGGLVSANGQDILSPPENGTIIRLKCANNNYYITVDEYNKCIRAEDRHKPDDDYQNFRVVSSSRPDIPFRLQSVLNGRYIFVDESKNNLLSPVADFDNAARFYFLDAGAGNVVIALSNGAHVSGSVYRANLSTSYSPLFIDEYKIEVCIKHPTYYFDYNPNTRTIIGWKNNPTRLFIPKIITDVQTVDKIGDNAFANCKTLYSVELPESVNEICANAFSNSGLTSVSIPNSAQIIGKDAFKGCADLQNVTIGSGVISIGEGAFQGCTKLTSIKIPGSVKTISENAFNGCSGLKKVELPEGITKISDGTFSGCSSLESVNIPKSVTSIGSGAFMCNYSLSKISFSQSDAVIGKVTFPESITNIGLKAFYNCSAIQDIRIPYTIRLGADAFKLVDSEVPPRPRYDPKGLSVIDRQTFKRDSNYSCMLIRAENPARCPSSFDVPNFITHIGDNAFENCTNLLKFNIPDSVIKIGKAAFKGCIGLTSIDIPYSVTDASPDALSGCTNLTSVNYVGLSPERKAQLTSLIIPDIIRSIPDNMFSNCTNLKKVQIPGSVKKIGANAFQGCTSLVNIVIREGISEISSNTFNGCSSLEFVTIPKSVTNIGEGAFMCNYKLKKIFFAEGSDTFGKVTFPESITYIGSKAFYNCSALKDIRIPYTIKLGEDAFKLVDSEIPPPLSYDVWGGYVTYGEAFKRDPNYSCMLIGAANPASCPSSFDVPDFITHICEVAFSNCKNLKSINIPYSLKNIGAKAFDGCNNLKSVILIGPSDPEIRSSLKNINVPYGITNIADSAFAACYKLNGTITMPDTLVAIGSNAFQDCRALDGINLNKVTSIGDYAFEGCTTLKKIAFSDALKTIGNSAFSGCKGLANIEIPNSVTSIGESAFYACSALGSIELPQGLTSIAKSAFEGCSNLERVSMPGSVTAIEIRAFKSCDKLADVEIPSSVKTIGDEAFYNDGGNQTNILITGDEPEMGNNVVNSVSKTNYPIK